MKLNEMKWRWRKAAKIAAEDHVKYGVILRNERKSIMPKAGVIWRWRKLIESASWLAASVISQ
jgi:hypothetical protein